MLMPTVFVSHGAPDIVLQQDSPTLACWQQLGKSLPRPKAILVLSAHWTSTNPTLSTVAKPATIHDFGGFPNRLYRLQYPAHGVPELAAQVQACLSNAGIPLRIDNQRGLDHGAWIPLMIMYPDADIPVTQLSIQPNAGTAWHLQLGKALQPLREQGVLILTSGAVTHNFAWLSRSDKPLPAAQIFSDWLGDHLRQRNIDKLLNYRDNVAPFGADSHPTEEHLLPLFVSLGASTAEDKLTRYTPEFTYSALAMDAYVWQ